MTTSQSMQANSEPFPTDSAHLPECVDPQIVELSDGDAFDLRIAPVAKRLGNVNVRMLSYNGSVPGPTLKVPQGSEVVVTVRNDGDLEGTVHWHGLRVENRYDGTHETQPPIPVGESFMYRLRFPDPGIYWYHPHIREDYGQELGLYGNILVVPADANYWPRANREVMLTLDDVLLEDGKVASFSRYETTHVAMGRFGNVLLTAGKQDLLLTANKGEVVRFYLTNTANTRVFNVRMRGARMKLVGGDSGRYEQEQFVDEVLLAPSERAVIDVLFAESGQVTLEHHTPNRSYRLAGITVSEEHAVPSLVQEYGLTRRNPDMMAERQRVARYLESPPDKTLAFIAEMDMGTRDGTELVLYTCPMHPEVISEQQGRCPHCGMKLLANAASVPNFSCPMHPEVVSANADRCPKCGMKLVSSALVTPPAVSEGTNHEAEAHTHHREDKAQQHRGIEWEDDMAQINRMTTPSNMRWKIVDRDTGGENRAIDWQFQVGDQVKIRLINEIDSDHPMHHPFHIHGAGRFLVLSRDGVIEPSLVWKDTVLVRTGQTVDILLDITNPGMWMAHCHIAEHHESGMMFSFRVTPPPNQTPPQKPDVYTLVPTE